MSTHDDLIEDGLRLKRLIDLAGYHQNGSDETVKLYQDDAARTYHVQIGNKSNYGHSFRQAIDAALGDGLCAQNKLAYADLQGVPTTTEVLGVAVELSVNQRFDLAKAQQKKPAPAVAFTEDDLLKLTEDLLSESDATNFAKNKTWIDFCANDILLIASKAVALHHERREEAA
jgi:hypothetical protein